MSLTQHSSLLIFINEQDVYDTANHQDQIIDKRINRVSFKPRIFGTN